MHTPKAEKPGSATTALFQRQAGLWLGISGAHPRRTAQIFEQQPPPNCPSTERWPQPPADMLTLEDGLQIIQVTGRLRWRPQLLGTPGGSTCRGPAAAATVGRRRAPQCMPDSGLWRWPYSGSQRPKESARAVCLPGTELRMSKYAITSSTPPEAPSASVQASYARGLWAHSACLFYLFSLPHPFLAYAVVWPGATSQLFLGSQVAKGPVEGRG